MIEKNILDKKLVFHRVMKTGDWWKLFIIIFFFIFCWTAVWFAYKEPLDYQAMLLRAEASSKSAQ